MKRLFLLAGLLVAMTRPALAADPLGTVGHLYGAPVHVVAPISMVGLNLVTHSVEMGALAGGVGLGVDLLGGALSPSIAGVVAARSGSPNFANAAFLVNVFRVAWVGAMVHVEPAFEQWSLLVGFDAITLSAAAESAP